MSEDFKSFYSALSVRSQTALNYSGCNSIDDVRKFMANRRKAMSMGNFGKKSYAEVVKALAKIPLSNPMINDLLDKLEEANRIFGAGIATGAENHADVELCRSAVDAKIKEMQDRIAELEGKNRSLSYNLKIADHRIKRLDLIITENL